MEPTTNATGGANDAIPVLEESDDDMYDVDFPIYSAPSAVLQPQNITQNDACDVDEQAVLRCFYLSIAAHVQNKAATLFEPVKVAKGAESQTK